MQKNFDRQWSPLGLIILPRNLSSRHHHPRFTAGRPEAQDPDLLPLHAQPRAGHRHSHSSALTCELGAQTGPFLVLLLISNPGEGGSLHRVEVCAFLQRSLMGSLGLDKPPPGHWRPSAIQPPIPGLGPFSSGPASGSAISSIL